MPKSRRKDGSIPKMKFRIGSRKGGKSALTMTNDELLAALESDNTRGRDKPKIRQVLKLRRVDLP
jgi:hypothetical protein